MKFLQVTLLIFTAVFTFHALAADGLKQYVVQVEHRLNAPVAQSWQALGRFCALSVWQSVVSSCDVVERNNGIIRTVVMQDNTVFVERLEEFSNAEHKFSYSMISGPVPVRDYHATFWIKPHADIAAATLLLQARFQAPPTSGSVIEKQLKQLFENGLLGINAVLANSTVVHGRGASVLAPPSTFTGARP